MKKVLWPADRNQAWQTFPAGTNRRCDRSRSGDAYWVLSQLPLCSPINSPVGTIATNNECCGHRALRCTAGPTAKDRPQRKRNLDRYYIRRARKIFKGLENRIIDSAVFVDIFSSSKVLVFQRINVQHRIALYVEC